jgi:serine/threonine protein kinase
MPRETPIGKEKESTVTLESSSAAQTLVDIPEQEEVMFRSRARKFVVPLEPDVHPTAFGWAGDHLILGPTDEDILIATNPLGHGSLGVVEEVRRIGGQFPTLVRKRVDLPLPKRKAAAYLKIVQEEARILRSLVHPHIVTLIGSYEDMKQPRRPSYCLLMSPVGENDLEAFLTIVGEHDIASEFSIRWRDCIRNWMACLASALKYMHASGIRHQDIKPSNIIHKGDHVFFTDFSSSSSFKIGHTTSTENPARSTPMYGAPEVTSDRGKHGRTTDIFSLGCVFSDMLSVAEGRTVPGFQDFLRNDGQPAETDIKHVPRALSYSEKVPTIEDWFADSHIFNTHVSQMLHPDRKVRPTATEVLQAFMLDEVCDVSCSCLRAEILQKELDTLSAVSVD